MLDIAERNSNLLLFSLGEQASSKKVCHVFDFHIFKLDAVDGGEISFFHACNLLGHEDGKVAEGLQIRAGMSENCLLTQFTNG